MQQSYRSPRQPVRTRSKPYTRRQPPPRSGSILATIRNIVTAPLSWFSTTDEFEDTPGKRRRVPVSQSNGDASGEHRSVKRQKVATPSPQPQGYLDPPFAMFRPHSKSEGAPQYPTSAAFPSLSININTQELQPDKLGRHSLAANLRSRRHQSREVSMDDLPSRLIAGDATMIPLPVSREASLSSVPRESSVGPVRAFRMRTTLSPIPAGSDYGPNPKRRERDPSEPPPLTALMSNPIFVKPPPNQHPTYRSQSAQPTTTLGALAQTSRIYNRVSPRQSNLHLNDSVSHDASLYPINASEIALSELAIYRTPLLPTRLRGSETIPEMFKPKKVHAVVPMKSGKPDLPRLGTGRKQKCKEDTRKPYSARGGVKKLLQRRKMEEEAEKEHSDHVMDSSDLNAGEGVPTSSSAAESVATPLPEPEIPQHRVHTRETSSLRVGRSRTNRQDRPTRPPRTKFSAAFEDDDPVDQKEQDVQRFEVKPMFEPPKDFTFSRDKTSADFAPPEPTKEPPIAALPFSLTPELSKSAFLATPASPAPQPVVPVISLSPPTPQKSESSSGIPNFFAASSLMTRTSFPPALQPPSGSLFGASLAKEPLQPTPLVTPDRTPISTETKDSVTSDPPEPIQPIPTPLALPVAAASTIASSPASIFTTPPTKAEAPDPTPAPLGGDPLKASFSTPVPPPSTQPPLSLFGGLPSHNPAPESTNVQPLPASTTTESNSTATGSDQKGQTSSMFSFGNSSGTPFVGFGVSSSTEGSKPFATVQSTPSQSPGESTKPPANVQTGVLNETKPGFSFTFKFGPPSTSPEKPTAPPFSEPGQAASNSGVFTFGTNSNTADTQKSLFGSFPRPVTPPREEEEVRMEESPTRVVEVANPRPNEDSFFGGRVLNFGQSNGNASSPFDFGTSSEDSNPFGSKLEKPKSSSGFTFGSSGSVFEQPSPAFTFGKVDNPTQPPTPSSPFTFGTSKLPEINTFGASQTTNSSPFNFGQRPGSSQGSQGSSGFTFSQQSPVTTSSPFNFGQGQTLAPPPFGQQSGSVPNSPSTFNQSLPFGFGSATPTSTSNPFSFQSPSPITTTPSNAPGFAFGQHSQAQAQPSTPVSPFPVPGSPQPAGGSLFNIGTSTTVQSPGTRAIKKLPTRRGGARR